MKKIVTIKNNESILLYLSSPQNDYYEINAFNKDYYNVGQTSFSIHKTNKETSSFLYFIKVEDNYLNKGLGSEMLKMYEDFLVSQNCYFIEGKYIPNGIGAYLTKNFYLRKGYTINDNVYDKTISKRLENKTKENQQQEISKAK